MKKILVLISLLFLGHSAKADEGMWLLKLMNEQHLEDSLRKAGLRLRAEALYSETAPSLREVVGIFGGGCTGEVVSPDGLVLTNNHCGFGYVHGMSTMTHNYLRDGYFAKSRSEELPVPGLTFTFVVRIQDVTAEVAAEARKEKADEYTAQSRSFLAGVADKLLKKSDLRKTKGIRARVVPYFGGNSFYVFYEQIYSDVRLVANPPLNVAQFGGNQDNWVWPRHNADFAMFRIYADEKGEPAAYDPANLPLRCRKFLPVSLKGYDENDYAMIMGFPGSTSRYLTASEVAARAETLNAPVALAGNAQLDFYKAEMDASDSVRLKYMDMNFSVGNRVKNFDGMNAAIRRLGLVEEKKREEAAFRKYAATASDKRYARVIDRIDSLIAAARDTLFDYNLFHATFGEQGFYVQPSLVSAYADALKAGKKKDIEAAGESLRVAHAEALAAIDLGVDRRMMQALLPYWYKHARLHLEPEGLETLAKAESRLDEVYAKSLFRSEESLAAFMKSPSASVLEADPLYRYWTGFNDFIDQHFKPALLRYNARRKELDKVYQRGLLEMYRHAKSPDANFTLRMTYGHVKDLRPRDAVRYDFKTTLEGMFEKENANDSDYVVNERLRELYAAKDYGRYARPDGKLQTCFLSNNDITGGNSGSPVMNADGELIGLAFDGNIESLSSDLKFDPQMQRCINVDIRYVLFILDKFGECRYVLDEMDIR